MRIAEVAFPVPLHKAFHYQVPAGLDARPGARVRAPFGPRRLVGTILSVFDGEPQRELKLLDAVLDREPALSTELLDCAVWMSRRYSAPIGECVRAVLPAYLKSLEEFSPERGEQTAPAKTAGPCPPPAWELTAGQAQALDTISRALAERRHDSFLLYGVPASGKTEVYLRLIRQVAAAGGQALFLVPEISLTGPFFGEFCASLRVPVVLWHSRLGERERRLSWLAVRNGMIRVVVGARSAALLPFGDLRLAVLDEEQDESFKQEGQSPQYHAREVTLRRAAAFNAVTVLGSATPSLESWQAVKRGAMRLAAMPDRVSSVARPVMTVLPLPPAGRCLSEELLAKVRDRVARREQVILLVNRRGFSTVLMCAKCGWVDRCPACGVAKIRHEDGSGSFVLRCHHCTRQGPVPPSCPQCANAGLRAIGMGTQKVVSELKRLAAEARVLRMDRDTLSQREADRRIYERFLGGEADILVGTKLVAKSFHFPAVTLVGVVDADTMLHMPDFRASERTMQLLAQVAGRSGRADKAGEVVLQSLHPEHLAVRGAIVGDYAAFADQELVLRRELGYPPFSALVRLLWTGRDESRLARAAQEAAEALRGQIGPSGHEVVGPAPAVLPKARGMFRYHALVKVSEPEANLDMVIARVRETPLPSVVRLKVNVDPYDLF
ncbi:MAG TPA: primosomal protein N' [Elusimicrobia bacterium]|nr:primosomal protein N' [Elusimicrobiota bacterium]HBT60929.1 primosomal protein N' [Elusimicrobiota bacterium]